MTTTNIYKGLDGQKSSSRVLAPPGGGSSNIFGHYQEQENRAAAQQKHADTQRVIESNSAGERQTDGNAFYQDKADYNAYKARNQGTEAPFATASSIVQVDNRGSSTGEPAPAYQAAEEYVTPKEKQANNPNLNKNTFNNIFGDEPSEAAKNNRGQAKASTHNPVTWEAYSNYDANADKPAHRSRFETHKDMRQGNSNPITGQGPDEKPAARARPPPGGISNITF